MKRQAGFTLIELALSIAVFAFGLTAVTVIYMVTLRWAEEVRIDLTALQSGRAVLDDASILKDRDDKPLAFTNLSPEAKGWNNDYFCIRSYDAAKAVTLPDKCGVFVDVRVEVYFGGDDKDGRKVHQLRKYMIVPESYTP